MSEAMLQSDLPFPVRRGKVRDVYDLGETLLIVATDRISAFDCIMPNGIPDKGKILTALSLFWFEKFPQIPNHLIATEVADYPSSLKPFAQQIAGRSMLVKKAKVVPIECVARGYLAGSGWKEYQQSQRVCGVMLPAGLKQSDKLPEPIFTPATKEESGHDINISFAETVKRIGAPLAQELSERTLWLYQNAADYAATRGVIIADTKFEFGLAPASPAASGRSTVGAAAVEIVLIDEVLTPDSSRFWPKDQYRPGHGVPSFDKQFVRDYLEEIHWNKQPPVPALPEAVVERTREKYIEAFRRLSDRELA